jgi:hypothetical protein
MASLSLASLPVIRAWTCWRLASNVPPVLFAAREPMTATAPGIIFLIANAGNPIFPMPKNTDVPISPRIVTPASSSPPMSQGTSKANRIIPDCVGCSSKRITKALTLIRP